MNQESGGLKDLVDSFKKPLERLWNALSKEKIKERKIESITTAFIKSMINKEFVIREGGAKILSKKLEKEPKEMASQLASLLKEIE